MCRPPTVIRGTLPADELKDKMSRGHFGAGARRPSRDSRAGGPRGVEVHASLVAGMLDGSIKKRPGEVLGLIRHDDRRGRIRWPSLPHLSAMWSRP